jgi:hypothetical protein
MSKNTNISRGALLALRGLKKEEKQRFADRIGKNIQTVYRWLQDNSDEMTKASIVSVISEETGLRKDQIIEEAELMGEHQS